MVIVVFVELKGSPNDDVRSSLNDLMKRQGFVNSFQGINYDGGESPVDLPSGMFLTEDLSIRAESLSASLTTLIHNVVWPKTRVFAMQTEDIRTAPELVEPIEA